MKSTKFHVTLGLAVVSMAFVAQAIAAPVIVPVEAARTNCISGALKRVTNSVATTGGGTVFTDDRQFAAAGSGNEVVWQVIGTFFDTSQPGEAYCGFLSLPGGVAHAGLTASDGIQDCVGIIRYAIPASSPSAGTIRAAHLSYAGTRVGGMNHTLAVTVCKNEQGPFTFDHEPVQGGGGASGGSAATTDCITSRDDFAGGSFSAIHDVMNQRKDNNTGIVGGVTDLHRAEAFIARDIALDAAFVAAANAAAGSTLTIVIRCADDNSHNNGWLGQGDNVLVLHDPGAFGFGGAFFGDIPLVLEY